MDLKPLSPVPWENVYHLGMVVDDIARAAREMGDELGLTFEEPRPANVIVRDASGTGPQSVLVSFARQGPPYVELIQSRSGGVWTSAGGPRMHHVGVWTDDLAKDVARFTRLGLEMEAHGLDAAGKLTLFAYMRDAQGLRIELVDSAGRAGLTARFSS